MKISKILAGFVFLCLVFTSFDSNAQVIIRKKRRGRKAVIISPRPKVVFVHPVRKVRVVRVLPSSTIVIRHRNQPYHFHNGYYYRPYANQYIITRPPVGIRISILPPGYRRIAFGSSVYYYSTGSFYVANGNQYVVAAPPIGIVVNSLPDEAEEVTLNNESLYEFNGVLYKKVTTPEGTAYEVAGEIDPVEE